MRATRGYATPATRGTSPGPPQFHDNQLQGSAATLYSCSSSSLHAEKIALLCLDSYTSLHADEKDAMLSRADMLLLEFRSPPPPRCCADSLRNKLRKKIASKQAWFWDNKITISFTVGLSLTLLFRGLFLFHLHSYLFLLLLLNAD